MKKFRSRLVGPKQKGTWTYFIVPFDVEKEYGSRAQVKVRGTVNGVPFRSSLFPSGDGTHYMVVNRTVRDAAGVRRGDVVTVEMERDTAPRTITVPRELSKALQKDPVARSAFDAFSHSHRKAFVDHINDGKQATTRMRRARKVVDLLHKGRTLK